MQYRNGDVSNNEDMYATGSEQRKQREDAMAEMGSNINRLWAANANMETPKEESSSSAMENDKDVDLEHYLAYVSRRYERLHFDDDIDRTRTQVYRNTSTMHGNAMYALNWAGQVTQEQQLSSTGVGTVTSSSISSGSNSTTVAILSKLRVTRFRYVAAQKRLVIAAADAVMRRIQKVMRFIAQSSVKRLRTVVLLSAMFLVLCIKPVMVEAYMHIFTFANPTK